MKICFPVEKADGLNSPVFNHFGSAPSFVVIDTESKSVTVIRNQDAHHQHGQCNPVKALDHQSVDVIIVGGIGAGALTKLNAMGIRVHRAGAETIQENLDLFLSDKLTPMLLQRTCIGHGPGGGCAH